MIKIKKLEIIFMIVMLILSSGSIFNILGINDLIQITLFMVVLIISIKSGFLKNKNYFTILILTLLSVLILFLFQAANYRELSNFYNNNNIGIFLLLFTCLLTGFYFNSKPNFLYYLNSILFFFTLHGIISCLIISLFPTQNTLFSSVDEGARYVGYFYVFFQRATVNYFGNLDPTFINYFGFPIQRAHGLAWEPGNFSAYVNIFIFLNLFLFKNRRNVIIGVLALVLAWSTNGLLLMLLQFFYFFIVNFKNFSKKYIIPKIVIGFIVLYALVIATMNNLDEKIYGDKSGSGAARFLNTVSALYTIYKHPFIGTGFDFQNYTKELDKSFLNSQSSLSSYVDSEKLTSVSSTNSFLRLYVQFGIPIALILTIGLFKQTLIPRYKFIFAVIIIVSTSSAPLMLTPFCFLFISSGLLNLVGVKNRYKILL